MTSAAVGGAEWCGAEWCLLAAAALALLASGAAAALRLSEASEIWRVSFQASDVS